MFILSHSFSCCYFSNAFNRHVSSRCSLTSCLYCGEDFLLSLCDIAKHKHTHAAHTRPLCWAVATADTCAKPSHHSFMRLLSLSESPNVIMIIH